jgi:hypothetical protein
LNSIKVIKRIGIKGDYFKTQVARCEMQKTVYSIKYIVSSEEKIKKVASCKLQDARYKYGF